MRLKQITAVAAIVWLAGCSHTPMPMAVSFPATTQEKMQAAHHWNVLAAHVVEQMQIKLGTEPAMGGALLGQPIYVNPPRMETPFERAFYDFLTSQMVNHGLIVTTNPDAATTSCSALITSCRPLFLKYNVEIVEHLDRDAPFHLPGQLTAAAGVGAWVAYGADNWNPAALAVIPLIAAAELFHAGRLMLPDETNTEVVITTSVNDSDRVLFSQSNVYYVNGLDKTHYAKSSRSLKVVDQ